jgi:hypothetical protein
MPLLGPAEVEASWPTPNYVDPVTRGPISLIVNIVFYVLMLLSVILRTYTRAFLSKSFGADDVLMLLALVSITSCRSTLGPNFHTDTNHRIWRCCDIGRFVLELESSHMGH